MDDLVQVTYCGLYCPLCEIYPSAQARGMDACPFCTDFPRAKIEALGERYPLLLADGRRLATIGIAGRIAEQDERVRAGLCYASIRCHPAAPPRSGEEV